MQSNFWAGSKNLERHKIFWDLYKDKPLVVPHETNLCEAMMSNFLFLLHEKLATISALN